MRWLPLLAAPLVSALELADFFSFPSRDNLVGCTAGAVDNIAWVETYQGQVSFWAATSNSANPPVQLAFNLPSAGWMVTNMMFHPHGDNLCGNLSFVLGPAADVNPTSSSVVPSATTWSFDMTNPTSPATKISDNQLAGTFDGETAYITSNKLGYSAVSTLSRPYIFATKTGSIDSLSLHPKYSKLVAFSNSRGDHSFIGLYGEPADGPAGQPNIVWVGPSVDSDFGMAWSQDGTQIAWVRTYDSVSSNGTYQFQMGNPFSIMVASVAFEPVKGIASVSNVRAVYSDWTFGYPDDTAGFGARSLAWSGNEVIFPSEGLVGAKGYLHVGAVDVTSLAVRDLSIGQTKTGQGCESRDFVLSPDAKSVFITHNCDLRESLGVVQVILADLTKVPVLVGSVDAAGGLCGNGAGMVPLSLGVFFMQSTFNNPLSVMYMPNGGSKSVELTPPNPTRYPAFNSSNFVKPKLVSFNSSDNEYVLQSQMFVPPADVTPKNIALLFTHGGSQRQMLPVFHFSSVYAQYFALNQYLASQGYLVLSTNYRSGVAYGHDFRVCKGCGYYGGREYTDVLTAGKWLANQAGIKKVGIHGLSYGGLNCLQALARNSDVFAAGVASAPVLNWVVTDAGDMKWQTFSPLSWGFRQLPMGPQSDLAGPAWPAAAQNNVAVAWNSSPVSAINSLKSPLLLIHGDNDNEVYFQESRGVLRALRRLMGPDKVAALIETLIFPDENHGLALFEHQLTAAQASVEFFNRRLK